jgi:formamidopyrimidine-DNA glycosylase
LPELPDLTVYIAALERRIVGEPLIAYAVRSPYVLRTVEPTLDALLDRVVQGVGRIGKRLVLAFDGEHFLAVHLMIAGRFRWLAAASRAKAPARITLAELSFPSGLLVLTEAGTTRRASLHVVRGRESLAAFDRGGLEPLAASAAAFGERLASENHTLKRSLTDPRLFAGIGNAYSDEILHRARLSPLRLTSKLTAPEVTRLHEATRAVLAEWTERLLHEAGDAFPAKVTAFHPAMAAHGRFGLPCPDCGAPIQRIRYRDNETNYCARCQTEGRRLADRALSRLLKDDWPRSIDEVE